MIAHANFPQAARSLLPVLHLGFDAVALLREAIARIATMRAGRTAMPYLQPASLAEGP